MIIANWSIIFFVVFYLSGILMFLNNKQNKKKYLSRLSGLLTSMFGLNSTKRINL